jgi:predicted PurR-regulated permease PerM
MTNKTDGKKQKTANTFHIKPSLTQFPLTTRPTYFAPPRNGSYDTELKKWTLPPLHFLSKIGAYLKETLVNKTVLVPLALGLSFVLAIWGLGDTLFPLFFSFVLAYLFFPLIKKLETKGFNRNSSVASVFALTLALFVLALILIVPHLAREFNEFFKELPDATAKALERVERVASSFGYELDLSKAEIQIFINEHTAELSGGLLKLLSKGASLAFSGATQWLVNIMNLFLFPLFFFYIINDYEKISAELKSLTPMSIRPKLSRYFVISNNVLGGYIRGQLLVALILCGLYGIGLSATGLRFGLLIGLISGVLSIIPYAGLSIGLGIAMLVGLANQGDVSLLASVLGVFVVVQMLEGFLITPKLVGGRVGLSPLATMLALVIGGNLFGLLGMLVAIPTAAILKSILKELKAEYLKLDIVTST